MPAPQPRASRKRFICKCDGQRGSWNSLRVTQAGTTLTVGPGVTVRGSTGGVGYNPNLGGVSSVAVVNQGTISADLAGGITVSGTTWVNQGTIQSKAGGTFNLQGSFTNAAKLAFARIGPAHEVYTQAIDYDPDVNDLAANDQAAGQALTAPAEDNDHQRIRKLLDLFDISQSWKVDQNKVRAMLTAAGCPDTDVIEKAIAGLSPQQARVFDPMLTEAVQTTVAAANSGGPS